MNLIKLNGLIIKKEIIQEYTLNANSGLQQIHVEENSL